MSIFRGILPTAAIAASVIAILTGAIVPSPASAAENGVVAAYTLVVPEDLTASNLQARAVIPNGISCPAVSVVRPNGKKASLKMTKRVPGSTTGPAFASLRACQANLPANLRSASIAGNTIPADLPDTYSKLALIGDTGCRVDVDDEDPLDRFIQNCNSPIDWPLAANSRAIAKEDPDVVLFTGDFFYRESACPSDPVADASDIAKCGGSPAPIPGVNFNDTDYGWMADVFIPMAPLFKAAPMLAVRGNHEQCDRGGNGYFLFFDVSPLGPAACAPNAEGAVPKNITPTWKFDMPVGNGRTLRAIVVDSAYGWNSDISSWVQTQRPAYAEAAQLASPRKGRESWLFTHRPMFGVESTEVASSSPTWNQWTSVDQTAAGVGLISNFNQMIASHVHVTQVVQIPGQPAQIIVGNGGSIPDTTTGYTIPAQPPLVGGNGQPLSPDYNPSPYQTASYLWTEATYGYSIAKPYRKAGNWELRQKNTNGETFAICDMIAKKTKCMPYVPTRAGR